jgi:hypothetical protein
MVEKIQSMIVRNSFGDENSAPMGQDEPEPDVREREDVERARVPVDREAAGFFAAVDRDREAAGFFAAGFEAVDFDAVERERDAAGFLAAVDFDAVDRERVAAGVEAVDGDRVADALDDPGRSSAATRRARPSISPRSPRSSSITPCCSSDSRTRVTARATSSTICVPRSFEPSGSARSTALRTASTASAAPELFLSFFFLSFLAMARV